MDIPGVLMRVILSVAKDPSACPPARVFWILRCAQNDA